MIKVVSYFLAIYTDIALCSDKTSVSLFLKQSMCPVKSKEV